MYSPVCLRQAPQRWKWGRGHHLPQDGIPQVHDPPPVEQQASNYFLWKHKYIQNIPQIHKIALHSSTTHSLPLSTKQHTVHNPLLIFALCDKCKCTLHCVTNANAYRVVLCHKCNCLSLTNANSNICQHSRGHTTLHQKILGLGKLGPQIQIQMKMQMQIHSRGQTTLHQNCSQISSTRLVELYVCTNWCVCVCTNVCHLVQTEIATLLNYLINMVRQSIFTIFWQIQIHNFLADVCMSELRRTNIHLQPPLASCKLEINSAKSYPDQLFPKKFGTLTPTNAMQVGWGK